MTSCPFKQKLDFKNKTYNKKISYQYSFKIYVDSQMKIPGVILFPRNMRFPRSPWNRVAFSFVTAAMAYLWSDSYFYCLIRNAAFFYIISLHRKESVRLFSL